MEVNHELFDQVYEKLDINTLGDVMEMSNIAFKLYAILHGTIDTVVKLYEPVRIEQYLVPCFLVASGIYQSPRPVIILESVDRRKRQMMNIATDLSRILNEMAIVAPEAALAIRDSKSNYLCRRRYLNIIHSSSGKHNPMIAKLSCQGAPDNIELINYTNLSTAEKLLICVQDCNCKCSYYHCCNYVELLKRIGCDRNVLQLCDPYIFINQIFDYYRKGRYIHFPHNAVVVISNPNTLESSAQSALTRKINRKTMVQFIGALLTATNGNKAHHHRVRLICERLEKGNDRLFNLLDRSPKSERVGALLIYVLNNLRKISNTCVNELLQNRRLKCNFEYVLEIFEDCVESSSVYEIVPGINEVKISMKTNFLRRELIKAVKFTSIQFVILSG